MPLSRCREVMDRISAIIDDEVGAAKRLRFHAHLLVCARCARYFEQFRLIKEAAGVVTTEDLPDDFDSVMDFVLDEIDG